MARRPLKPCAHPGCPELIRSGARCDPHQRKRATRYARQDAKRRGAARQRGYGWDWTQLSRAHRKAEPLCRECCREDRARPVEDVDHVIPHRKNRILRLSVWNLQSLCRKCHNAKTAREPAEIVSLVWPLNLLPARSQFTVVVGPPGSGKSTHTAQHAAPDDVVVDLDALRAPGQDHEVARALHERNRILRSALGRGETVWLEVTAKRHAERAFWAEIYGAEVVVLPTPLDECRRRLVDRDSDPSTALEVCERWFQYDALDAPYAEAMA